MHIIHALNSERFVLARAKPNADKKMWGSLFVRKKATNRVRQASSLVLSSSQAAIPHWALVSYQVIDRKPPLWSRSLTHVDGCLPLEIFFLFSFFLSSFLFSFLFFISFLLHLLNSDFACVVFYSLFGSLVAYRFFPPRFWRDHRFSVLL